MAHAVDRAPTERRGRTLQAFQGPGDTRLMDGPRERGEGAPQAAVGLWETAGEEG